MIEVADVQESPGERILSRDMNLKDDRVKIAGAAGKGGGQSSREMSIIHEEI
jgi:hypothetical protein